MSKDLIDIADRLEKQGVLAASAALAAPGGSIGQRNAAWHGTNCMQLAGQMRLLATRQGQPDRFNMQRVLDAAHKCFVEYAESHAAKGTAEADAKAVRNWKMAEAIDVVLNRDGPDPSDALSDAIENSMRGVAA